jgi:hypothetical protein
MVRTGGRGAIIYGYARLSTDVQDLTSQLAQLRAAGCEKMFREEITSTIADRPALRKPMAALNPGKVVIIPAVDRLSRDTTDLLVLAREMQRAGAGICSLAEPFLDTTSDFAEIVFAILGVAAKLEHRRTSNTRHAALGSPSFQISPLFSGCTTKTPAVSTHLSSVKGNRPRRNQRGTAGQRSISCDLLGFKRGGHLFWH